MVSVRNEGCDVSSRSLRCTGNAGGYRHGCTLPGRPLSRPVERVLGRGVLDLQPQLGSASPAFANCGHNSRQRALISSVVATTPAVRPGGYEWPPQLPLASPANARCSGKSRWQALKRPVVAAHVSDRTRDRRSMATVRRSGRATSSHSDKC